MKTLKAVCTSWSYIVNENGNGFRVSLEGYGSSTPIDVLQDHIDQLTSEQFEATWQNCEKINDIID